jgi:hypothetical protein
MSAQQDQQSKHIYIPNLVGGQMVKVPIVSDAAASTEDMSTDPVFDSRCIYLSLPLSSLNDEQDDYFTAAATNKASTQTRRTTSRSSSVESVSIQE